jgi:hypothetical protein
MSGTNRNNYRDYPSAAIFGLSKEGEQNGFASSSDGRDEKCINITGQKEGNFRDLEKSNIKWSFEELNIDL